MRLKHLLLLGCIPFMVASCGNAESEGNDMNEEMTTTEEVASDKIDPICKMTYEASWEEYSVQGNDTIWFCSEYCKTSFDANPALYGY